MVIFHSYVTVYQRVYHDLIWFDAGGYAIWGITRQFFGGVFPIVVDVHLLVLLFGGIRYTTCLEEKQQREPDQPWDAGVWYDFGMSSLFAAKPLISTN